VRSFEKNIIQSAKEFIKFAPSFQTIITLIKKTTKK